MSRKFYFIGFLLLFGLVLSHVSLTAEDEVKKDFRIPFFVVDASSQPRFDVQKSDLTCSIGDKTIGEFSLTRVGKDQAIPGNGRLICLVLDAMFTSNYGVKRTRSIASELVKNAGPGDSILVLANSPSSGIEYLIGPTSDKDEVLKQIKKAKLFPGFKWFNDMFGSKSGGYMDRFSASSDHRVNEMVRGTEEGGSGFAQQYFKQVLGFTRKVAQLQFALQMVQKPKVVYYFAEGFQKDEFVKKFEDDRTEGTVTISGETVTRGARSSSSSTSTKDLMEGSRLSGAIAQYLSRTVKALVASGNVVFIVNPGKSKTSSYGGGGSADLEFHIKGNGEYFQGTDFDTIMGSLKNASAAYYELSGPAGIQAKKGQKLVIKSAKPETKLYVPGFIPPKSVYKEMEEKTKKGLAYNILTGGLTGQVVFDTTRITTKPKIGKRSGQGYQCQMGIAVPKSLAGKKLDVFTIMLDKKVKKLIIKMASKTVSPKEMVQAVVPTKKSELFVVMIDPDTLKAVSSKVK